MLLRSLWQVLRCGRKACDERRGEAYRKARTFRQAARADDHSGSLAAAQGHWRRLTAWQQRALRPPGSPPTGYAGAKAYSGAIPPCAAHPIFANRQLVGVRCSGRTFIRIEVAVNINR